MSESKEKFAKAMNEFKGKPNHKTEVRQAVEDLLSLLGE